VPRLGLVLAGGGGKGAYQAGCLQYLADIGWTDIVVISGASIGALNAAAVASGGLEHPAQIWRRMCRRRILWPAVTTPVGMFIVGIYAVRFLGTVAIIGSPILIFVTLVLGTHRQIGLLGAAAVALLVTFVIEGLLWTFAAKTLAYRLMSNMLRMAAESIRNRGSILSSKRLRKLLQRELRWEREERYYRCPTFVTTARMSQWFDPDLPTFHIWPQPESGFPTIDLRDPAEARGWLPVYRDIAALREAEALDAIIASAALPVIFRAGRSGVGQALLDGGLVDNSPITPTLDTDCDLIIVIHLRNDPELPMIALRQLPRLPRVVGLEASEQSVNLALYYQWLASTANDPADVQWLVHEVPHPQGFELVPLPLIERLPPLIQVVPECHLGNFVTGTLNFSRRKARRLIARGYDEMHVAIYESFAAQQYR
jgi:hypothetical protein